MQTTIASKAQFRGVGLHSGAAVRLAILPAPADHGIVFVRTDLGRARIPALWDHVTPSQLCTLLDNGQGATVSTVEHVMAALAGTGITNAVVEVNGPEIPILDGSAAPFVFLIDCAGVTAAAPYAPRDTIEVLKPIRVEEGSAWAELHPNSRRGMEISLAIAFEGTAVGRQDLSLPVTPDSFREVLADARTFTMAEDVARLRAVGLARGGSLANAVVVDGPLVLNPGGLRHPQEFVRHKMMDVVGDLFLAGAPLRACFRGHKSGHSLNNRLLRALFADPTAWRIDSQATENASAAANARLPLAAAPA